MKSKLIIPSENGAIPSKRLTLIDRLKLIHQDIQDLTSALVKEHHDSAIEIKDQLSDSMGVVRNLLNIPADHLTKTLASDFKKLVDRIESNARLIQVCSENMNITVTNSCRELDTKLEKEAGAAAQGLSTFRSSLQSEMITIREAVKAIDSRSKEAANAVSDLLKADNCYQSLVRLEGEIYERLALYENLYQKAKTSFDGEIYAKIICELKHIQGVINR